MSSSAINSLYVLAEKVIALTSSGVDYYQFRNISGPALKVGSQLVTKNSSKNGRQWKLKLELILTWATFFLKQERKVASLINSKMLTFHSLRF
ncbi:hypothetical protein OH492_14365 [Vibrio chagasii]|nr:hypothetical protein [Vibrio chagasii]